LKDVSELQSYFIKRIERFVNSKGRKIIGWDEILEGGLAPGAAVMSWRGFEGGAEAAKSGHNVVMSPVSHCYFDYYQGDPSTEPTAGGGYLTLSRVYSFDPVPAELTPEEAKFIMGAQANLWTEYVATPSHAEYMVVPRMTALSEVLWSPAEKRNWNDFSKRLAVMFRRFDIMGINYSHGTFAVNINSSYNDKTNRFNVSFSGEQVNPEIRYTTDGTDPSMSSARYKKPFAISKTATIKAAIFKDGKMMGAPSVKEIGITLATGKKVTYNEPYSHKYKACEDSTLVNGIMGSPRLDDGQWQGFEGNNMDVIIDLGKEVEFTDITADFLSAPGSWVFLPEKVTYYISADGKNYTNAGSRITAIKPMDQVNQRVAISLDTTSLKARYIRVVAGNIGTCPAGHAGEGGKAWIFSDEITVR